MNGGAGNGGVPDPSPGSVNGGEKKNSLFKQLSFTINKHNEIYEFSLKWSYRDLSKIFQYNSTMENSFLNVPGLMYTENHCFQSIRNGQSWAGTRPLYRASLQGTIYLCLKDVDWSRRTLDRIQGHHVQALSSGLNRPRVAFPDNSMDKIMHQPVGYRPWGISPWGIARGVSPALPKIPRCAEMPIFYKGSWQV